MGFKKSDTPFFYGCPTKKGDKHHQEPIPFNVKTFYLEYAFNLSCLHININPLECGV